MVMVYAGGHISGAHYNPAVTLAVWIRGRCHTSDVIPYWISQVIGAVLAALAVKYLKSDAVPTAMALSVPRALLAEFLFTFALAYVVLNVATSKDTVGNSYYGLAIGFTVLAGAFAVGSISGGVFNPAVAIGISLMGISAWANIWLYLVANFLGAGAAAVVFRAIRPAEDFVRVSKPA
jgi:aquaporin Z